ncbi:MAG: phosphatase PAP2 family protein [Rudaea sp.]
MSSHSRAVRRAREASETRRSPLPEFLGEHRLALFYLAGSLIIFVLLTVAVRQTRYFPFDLSTTRWLQSFRSPTLDAVMEFVGYSGFFPQTVFVNALIIAVVYLCGLKRAALTLLVGGVFVGITTTLLRYGLDRPRPSPDLVFVLQQVEKGHYSFPSGHVTGFTAILGFLLFLGLTRLRPSWHSRLILLLYAVYIALVGISRIYVGEHWLTDVLGGYLYGSFCLVLMILLYRWLGARGRPAAPPSP